MKESLEMIAEDFLRKNDPQYNSKRKPYKSHRQQRRIKSREIDFSNLSRKQRKSCSYVGDGIELEEF